MLRTVVSITMVVAIAGVVGVLGLLPVAAQAEPSATRSFDPSTTVEPGEAGGVVTIEAAGYGQGSAAVTETLPEGFVPTYPASLPTSTARSRQH